MRFTKEHADYLIEQAKAAENAAKDRLNMIPILERRAEAASQRREKVEALVQQAMELQKTELELYKSYQQAVEDADQIMCATRDDIKKEFLALSTQYRLDYAAYQRLNNDANSDKDEVQAANQKQKQSLENIKSACDAFLARMEAIVVANRSAVGKAREAYEKARAEKNEVLDQLGF